MNKDDKKTVEDQELADMIASMKGGAGQPAAKPAPGMQPNPVQGFKVPTPPPKPPVAPAPDSSLPPVPPPPADGHLPVGHDPIKPGPTPPPVAPPKPPVAATPPVPPVPPKGPAAPDTLGGDPELAHIKRDAIQALRPLVNELDLPAEEKFNTLLLLIRSTDDKSLIQPAYEAVQQITDDTKKAQALLDIVKEIDFFENLNK